LTVKNLSNSVTEIQRTIQPITCSSVFYDDTHTCPDNGKDSRDTVSHTEENKKNFFTEILQLFTATRILLREFSEKVNSSFSNHLFKVC